jgi:FKBP-type peptidyl-prolyl cis-trans isomerase SlyD
MSDNNIINHKYVEFRYTISESDGNFLQQAETLMHYIHGIDNDMFPKIEDALSGCQQGDRIQVLMTPEESYGQYQQELVHTDNINNVPKQYRKLGAQVEFQSDKGDKRKFRVSKIRNGKLTLDGNHPLAGKNLTFSIEVTNVRDATDDEIKQGYGVNASTIIH